MILGTGVAYYGGATGGPVIVPVTVAIYVATVPIGRLRNAVSEDATPEVGRIDGDEPDAAD